MERRRCRPPTSFKGLPEADQIVALAAIPTLDLWDPALSHVSRATAIELAKRAEAASLAFDPRASISNGSSYGQSKNRSVTGNSRGFLASTESGWSYVSAGIVAKDGDEKQTGSWASQKRFFAELQEPELIGQIAAQKAVERLGGKRVKSQVVPMVVDRFMAARFLGYLAQAASGNALFTRQSFLLGKQGEQVAHPDISIVDDAHIRRALGSRPFGEHGLPSGKRDIVQHGELTNYFVDLYSSRRLNMAPNGGGTSNLCILAGKSTPEEIIGSVDKGLYLQGISGHGFNPTNGNISFSATGYWIENGKKSFPVQGITIAGNLLDLFLSVEAVGDDLIWDRSTTAPTLKFKAIAVAGE